MTRRHPALICIALGFALLVPLFGYMFLGPLYAALFLVGYLGGFLFWIAAPARATWRDFRLPYWLALAAFVLLHKVEENRTHFFESVSTRITGTPVPDVSLALILALLIVPVGAWLTIPMSARRHQDFGRFLAWTFLHPWVSLNLPISSCRFWPGVRMATFQGWPA